MFQHYFLFTNYFHVRQFGDNYMTEKEMATHSSILAWRILMDRGAWRAAVHGVAMNITQLSE